MMIRLFRRLVAGCRGLLRLRLSAVMAGGLILMLFMGLFQQAQVLKGTEHYQIISRLRALDRANLIVVADALKIRLTLLPNYDMAVADSQSFHTQLTALEQSLDPLLPAAESLQQALFNLKAQALDRAVLVEDLKSENAVLQNSVSYLPTAVARLANQLPETGAHYQLKALLNTLLSALLQYTLDADNGTALEIEQLMLQVETLSQDLRVAPQLVMVQPALENLNRHMQAILYLKPQVTDTITRITDAPVGAAIEQLAMSYEAYHRQVTHTQKRYQRALYIATLFLLIGSGYLVWNYRNSVHLQKTNGQLSRLVSERTQDLNQTLETLKHSQSQLIQAEKMSALGQLSAGIAHEINNPINFVHGNVCANERYSRDCLALLDLYAQQYPNPGEDIEDFLETVEFDFLKEDWFKLFDSMRTGTARVKTIVESLRNFSRLDESDCKNVDLHEGIESTLLLLNHRLRPAAPLPAITVVKNYQSLPNVSCHPGSINQVFMHILTNAIDAFSPEQLNPTITISTSTLSIDADSTADSTAGSTADSTADSTDAGSTQVVVTIADNGSGMAKDVQAKIFDPFFTLKPVGKGTGLGLSVSYQTIVEDHAGFIDVTSTLGEGSVFRIQLPMTALASGKAQKNEVAVVAA